MARLGPEDPAADQPRFPSHWLTISPGSRSGPGGGLSGRGNKDRQVGALRFRNRLPPCLTKPAKPATVPSVSSNVDQRSPQ